VDAEFCDADDIGAEVVQEFGLRGYKGNDPVGWVIECNCSAQLIGE
jgi:hypothetical protein